MVAEWKLDLTAGEEAEEEGTMRREDGEACLHGAGVEGEIFHLMVVRVEDQLPRSPQVQCGSAGTAESKVGGVF